MAVDQSNICLSENEIVEPKRSQGVRKDKYKGLDFIFSQNITFLVKGTRDSVINKITFVLNIKDDPQTFKEATTSRDSAFWKELMDDEMDSILSNNT